MSTDQPSEVAPEGEKAPIKQEVGAGEILDRVGKAEEPPLSPLQRAGMKLALGVGLAIAGVTLLVLIDWLSNRPALPQLPPDTAQAKAALENFQALNTATLTRATELFDLIVAKAFLPVFTGILGYIFGSKQG